MRLETTLRVHLKAISPSGPLLLLLLLHFQGGIIRAASAASTTTEQKCDKVVAVETQELLSYLGNVTFTVPSAFKGRWTAVIKFTSPYTFIGGWGVQVQSFGRKAYAVFNSTEDGTLKAGDKVVFQFRVLYGYNAKVPKVLSIKWENKRICGPPILISSAFRFIAPSVDEQPSLESLSHEDDTADEDQFQAYRRTNNVRLVPRWKEVARKY